MIELTKEQINKVVGEIGALTDSKLSDEGFKAKVNAMGITGSDEDMKAFKAQIHELVAKKDELNKLSEDELEKAVGGISSGAKKGLAISGITVGSIVTIALACLGWKKYQAKKRDVTPYLISIKPPNLNEEDKKINEEKIL